MNSRSHHEEAARALALLASISAGCDIFVCGPFVSSLEVCPSNVTLYRIPTGNYQTMSAQVVMNTCEAGVTPAELMTDRTVENDPTTGSIIVKSTTGAELGRGPVRCNVGTLTYGPMMIDSGVGCPYYTTRTMAIEVTADAHFTMNFREDRSSTTNATLCSQPTTCTMAWSVIMKQ